MKKLILATALLPVLAQAGDTACVWDKTGRDYSKPENVKARGMEYLKCLAAEDEEKKKEKEKQNAMTEEKLRQILTSKERCHVPGQPIPLEVEDGAAFITDALACGRRQGIRSAASIIEKYGTTSSGTLPWGFNRERLHAFLAGGHFECGEGCDISHIGKTRDIYEPIPSMPSVNVRTETWGGGLGTTSTITIKGETVGSHTIIHK